MIIRFSFLFLLVSFSLACSGGGGGPSPSQQASLRFVGGEEFTAEVRGLQPSPDPDSTQLQAGNVLTESSFNVFWQFHEMKLSVLSNYQVEVFYESIPVFKTLVFSDELLGGSGPLELGYINAGSTFFTELSLSAADSEGRWNELVLPYGLLDPYSGRRDLRLASILSIDNQELSVQQRHDLALRILAARLLFRLVESIDEGDGFWPMKTKTLLTVKGELDTAASQAISTGVADLPQFYEEAFAPYYTKYLPLDSHLQTLSGNQHLVVQNANGLQYSIATASVPELVGVDYADVGVLQRWNVWDDFASLLASMESGGLLTGATFENGLMSFRTFDDRSTGAKAAGDAFAEEFGYDNYLVSPKVTLIDLNALGDTPTSIAANILLNPVN